MMKSNIINLLLWTIMLMILMNISLNLNAHPVFTMIFIIIYSIMVNLNMSLWTLNFMYSIMLFLIMISGLLIIFLYFSSLISNEQMNIQWNKKIYSSLFLNIMYMMIIFMLFKLFINNLIYISNENNSIYKINNKLFENILNLYNYPFNMITIASVFFLLITMFIIIKMTNMKIKPLRKIK